MIALVRGVTRGFEIRGVELPVAGMNVDEGGCCAQGVDGEEVRFVIVSREHHLIARTNTERPQGSLHRQCAACAGQDVRYSVENRQLGFEPGDVLSVVQPPRVRGRRGGQRSAHIRVGRRPWGRPLGAHGRAAEQGGKNASGGGHTVQDTVLPTPAGVRSSTARPA